MGTFPSNPSSLANQNSRSSRSPPSILSSRRSSGDSCDLERVGLRPYRFAGAEVEAVHGGLQMVAIHFDKQVVVVDLFALERVGGGAFNGIGMSSGSA